MTARDLTTDELVAELTHRGALPVCRCGKWQTYFDFGIYDRDGYTLRCHKRALFGTPAPMPGQETFDFEEVAG